jgi:hypothetical protein
VRLKEAQPSQFVRVYELLADESAGIRHAVAELVASALQEQGRQLLQARVLRSLLAAGWLVLGYSPCVL